MIKHFFLVVLLIAGGSVSAFSPHTETFVIRNYSSKPVMIYVEYSEDPSKIFYGDSSWTQDVDGLNLNFRVYLGEAEEYWLQPHQVIAIIYYYPRGNDEVYRRLDQIPFIVKMKSIYKTLRIVTEDGKKVITLENLGDQIIKKAGVVTESVSYYLEIFDYDLVGKPAKEW